MRLIFVIRSLANLHGVERTITDKINYFAENGHDVAILTYEQGSHPFAFPLSSQAKIKHVDLDCRYFPLYQFFFLKRLCKSWKLRTVFKDRLVSFVKDFNKKGLFFDSERWFFAVCNSVYGNAREARLQCH